jgi:O-6-methylguanine DNA methyltransferase
VVDSIKPVFSFHKGGIGMTIEYTVIPTDFGQVFVAESCEGLCFVHLGQDGLEGLTRFAKRWYPGEQIIPSIVTGVDQIEEYLDGGRKEFDLKLDIKGTDFQKKVWRILLDIPYGQTRSYGEIAKLVGQPNSSRAVGGACGANHLPIIVPCHRVKAANGGLCGFSSGVELKERLLQLESQRY